MDHSTSNRYFYSAIVFLLAGVLGGIYMSASHDHQASPAHAHLLLLGWVSMAIFGIFYRLVPEAANSLARLQWLLMTLAVPVLAAAIVMIRYDNAGTGEPMAAVSSFVILGALILFAINVVRNLARPAQAPAPQPAE